MSQGGTGLSAINAQVDIVDAFMKAWTLGHGKGLTITSNRQEFLARQAKNHQLVAAHRDVFEFLKLVKAYRRPPGART